MTREEFDVLIRKLEAASRRQPRLYLARIVGLVALAYGYLALILFGSLALCAAMVMLVVYAPATLKFGLVGLIAFGGIFWAVLRGLWVRLEAPKGQIVTRAQAPKLIALLDELRGSLNCRPFHQVLLVGNYNAAVVQIPRLGIFGWHRNYLLLGLPLMQALAPDEFKAVLAHEFAHSSRGHGRFGNWLYRVRRTWDQVFQQMAPQRSRFGFVLFKFLNWFWPIFNGHAFALARANEYEADACSVRLAGADAAARALMRLPVDGSLLQEVFWPHVFARANTDAQPPGDVALALGQTLKAGAATPDIAAGWLRRAFLLETNNVDTHPCLKDRLRAIGCLPDGVQRGEFPPPPPPPAQSAAEEFLGPHAETVARLMSDEWQKAIAKQWSARHEQAKKLAQELAGLDQSPSAPPSAAELWERARKLIDLKGDAEALPVVTQVLAIDPRHAGANFVLGRHHLAKDDPRGVELIETAMSADLSLTGDCCKLLYGHFARTGQRDKLRPLEHRVDAFREMAARAQRERAAISAKDSFLAAELTAEQLAALRNIFAAEPDIDAVAIARKAVQLMPQSPCFVVGLRLKVAWWKPRSTSANQALVNRVLGRMRLPGYLLVFVADQKLKALGKKVFAVPGAVIYRKAKA